MVQILSLSGITRDLEEGLRSKCKADIVKPYTKIFPDGEQYLRLPDILDQEIYVAQSLYPEQDRKIVELYLAIEAVKGLDRKVKALILPYVAYARQDKRFLLGEPISINALYQGLKIYGVNTIVAIDVHSPEAFSRLEFKLINILPHLFMAKYAESKIEFVVAPDKGALHRAKVVAEGLGIGLDYLDKYRDRVTGEIRINTKELDIYGKTVAIVDDIISTGGTLAKAVDTLYGAGAKHIIAIVSHAFLSSKSIDNLEKVGLKELIISNTIEQKISLPKWIKIIDISPLICPYIL